MTVRNIRAYQARGLLPPPIVDGRVGYYTQAHRERLTMIRRLRAEGFNLVAISALLTGVVPSTTPAAEATSGTGLSDAGAALLGLGVPVDAVLSLHRQVGAAVEQVAVAYAGLFEAHVRGPWLAAGSPPAGRHRVVQGAAALPPIAAAAVTSSLTPALQRLVQTEPVVPDKRAAVAESLQPG